MLDPRSTSGAEARISGFLSSSDMNLGVPMEFPQGSQASSCVEKCKSTFLSSCQNSASLPVELIYGSVAFFQDAKGLSHLPLRCESVLGVTVQSVQRNQLYLLWIGILGSFGMVARPLEFSKFNLRLPLLEV